MQDTLIGQVITQIVLLKNMIIVTGVGTVLLLITLLFLCRRFSWEKRNLRLIGFFYEARMYDSVLLAICLVRFYLVISILITKGTIYPVHIFFYGALVLLYNIIRHNLKEMFVSVFNGVLIMGILYVAGFLISYLENVLFDVRILIALIFLAIFLVLYALYDMAGCILNIIESRGDEKVVAETAEVEAKA